MSPSVKKGIIVVAIVVIAGGALLFFSGKKKIKQMTGLDPADPGTNSTPTPEGEKKGVMGSVLNAFSPKHKPVIITPPPPTSAPTSPGIKIPVQQIQLTKAGDLLATNINAANGKPIYATSEGVGVYNLANIKSFSTKKNQYLGVVTQARQSGNSFIIYFLGNGNAKFFIPALYAAIRTK